MKPWTISNGRMIAGNILIFLNGFILIFSSVLKFAHVPGAVERMTKWGYDSHGQLLIAVVELITVLLFLIPSTRSIGLLLVSAYLGGAIATHLEHGEPFPTVPPAIILLLTCLGSWLRHPAVLWSLPGSQQQKTARISSTATVSST